MSLIRRCLTLSLVLMLLVPNMAFAATPTDASALSAAWLAQAEWWANHPVSAADVGATDAEFAAITARLGSTLRTSGVSATGYAAGTLASGIIVGTGISVLGNYLIDNAFGKEPEWFTADGTRVGSGDLMAFLRAGGKVYMHLPESYYFNEKWDSELDWMFGAHIVPTDDVPEYDFTPIIRYAPYLSSSNYLVASATDFQTLPIRPDIEGIYPNHTSGSNIAWTPEAETLATFICQHTNGDKYPIVPLWSKGVSAVWSGSLINRVNGAVSPRYDMYWEKAGVGNANANKTYLGYNKAQEAVTWIETQMAMLNLTPTNGMHQSYPAEAVGRSAQPSGAGWYKIDGSTLPSTGSPTADQWDSATKVPAFVPDPVKTAAGGDTDSPVGSTTPPAGDTSQEKQDAFYADYWQRFQENMKSLFSVEPDYFQEAIGTQVAAMQFQAESHWPFAAISFLRWSFDSISANGSGQWEWDLPVGGGIVVHLAPLQWAQGLSPYRWIFVGALSIEFVYALWIILEPQIHV